MDFEAEMARFEAELAGSAPPRPPPGFRPPGPPGLQVASLDAGLPFCAEEFFLGGRCRICCWQILILCIRV